jgi:UPF0716 family protein affecting phage T7 exclusion
MILVGVLVLVFLFPLTRKLILMALGRQISKAAQRGRFHMEVRTWNFGSPHFKQNSAPRDGEVPRQEVLSDSDFVPELKDVRSIDVTNSRS